MIESSQSVNELPYRARIMMNAISESGKRTGSCSSARNSTPFSCISSSLYADLQPLQWLQQDAILSIAPLDHEEEFVPGREDIVSVITSPIKVEVVSDCTSMESDPAEKSTTIADFYRYQAMRAALATVGGQNGVRGQHGICVGSISRTTLQNAPSLNEYQKPPFSYTHIIFMAIETSPNKAMTVNDIYVWCETHFPYYTQAGVGWKNSLRHNLSINKSFKKISRDGRGGPGRGAYWVVEPRERNNLIDAIRRSPCSLGNLPFLNSMYPIGSGGCYSSNSFNANLASLSATRSLISSKLNSDLHTNSRGSLLRIGGQITDATQLIRSSPVIQRLSDSTTSIIELSKPTQVISTVPLLQLEQINFEPEDPHTSVFLENLDGQCFLDDSCCKGTVIIQCEQETDPEYEQSYIDITRSLMENEIDKSDSGRTESIKVCPENARTKPPSQHKYPCHDSGVIEDILPSEDVAPLTREIIKKHCSLKQRKRYMCDKFPESDSDGSMTSISLKDYSEQSDTDFNWRSSMGRQRFFKNKKSFLIKKLKSISNHRKLHSRGRVNNIIRAPHSDHVYAILQKFLPPANVEHPSNNIDNIDENDCFSIPGEEKSLDKSISALSKRSKHKLLITRGSSSNQIGCESDQELHSMAENVSDSRSINRLSFELKPNKRKANKSVIRNKLLKYDRKEDAANAIENFDDDEEQENWYFDENDNGRRRSNMKNRELEEFSAGSNYTSDLIDAKNEFGLSFKNQSASAKDLLGVKRKVGRPKKSDQDSSANHKLADTHKRREKMSTRKLKKTSKLLKQEMSYLKESNSNKQVETSTCNKEEQVAIDILVNLQRKSNQERINNMYNLSTFIDLNHHHDPDLS